MLKFVRAAALAGATLMMAHGAYAETVIKTVMHSPLRLTDPHATTAYITTWHGYMIYDTLLATDADNKIQPQMLEKWEVSPDGKTYTMTLREGQSFTLYGTAGILDSVNANRVFDVMAEGVVAREPIAMERTFAPLPGLLDA